LTARILALSGGIGGAKLVLGLYQTLGADELAVLVNSADDFEHLGLYISPDVDTLLYTLAGLADPERGWGRAGETWQFMGELRRLGGEDWFSLGDKDLALHVERTRRLRDGATLTAITGAVAGRFGIRAQVLPMSDQPVRTILSTDAGVLDFQRYFVGLRAQPAVRSIEYRGAAAAAANPKVLSLLADPALEAVILCPSNPWLSIAPLLAIPALRAALSACTAPVVAVSPIVGGAAIKGPTAKIMTELGLPVTAAAVARYYGDLLDGYVLDRADARLAPDLGLPALVTTTVMKTDEDKRRLAREVVAFARQLT
jgi:LPPG:FO 2-phospho-L-lactate transferase